MTQPGINLNKLWIRVMVDRSILRMKRKKPKIWSDHILM